MRAQTLEYFDLAGDLFAKTQEYISNCESMNLFKGRARAVILILAAFLVVAVVLIAIKWGDVSHVISQATWPETIVAVLFCLASDACLGYGYLLVNKAFGITFRGAQLLEIGFVSSTLNNVMALFGAAAHSMRVILVREKGIESGDIVAASLFHSYVSNIIMLGLFIVGLLSLFFAHIAFGSDVAAVAIAVVMVAALFVLVTATMVVGTMRRWALMTTRTLWQWVSHRDITPFITDLDQALTRGLFVFRQHPRLLAGLLAVTMAQWAFAAGGLFFCFAALGKGPPVSLLLAGYSIGISAGNLSMIPGGLGVQEASMAGVFAMLGVPFAQAALAAILFRMTDNFIPFFISLPLYAHLIRGRREKQ